MTDQEKLVAALNAALDAAGKLCEELYRAEHIAERISPMGEIALEDLRREYLKLEPKLIVLKCAAEKGGPL